MGFIICFDDAVESKRGYERKKNDFILNHV